MSRDAEGFRVADYLTDVSVNRFDAGGTAAELRPSAEHVGATGHFLQAGDSKPIIGLWMAAGHKVWWPDELPPPRFEGVQGSRTQVMPETADRIADLETVNAGLRAQLAFKTDRLASVETHNAELVAKYEALRSLHYALPQQIGDAFPANALGHAPKRGPR